MDFGNAVGEFFRERNHVRECGGSEDVFERGANGGERKRVACERAADAAGVAIFELNAAGDFLRDVRGAAVGGGGKSAGDGFADDEKIGLEAMRVSVAAGAGADGVGLVNDEERAEFSRECGGFFPVARVGMDDADIGEDRFGEDAGDVAMGEFPFERGEIVEFDDAGGLDRIYRRADISAARAGDAIVERDVGFVHGAVIAVVEDENFGALGDFAGDADGEAVGVGGGESKLPVGQAEAAGEFFADPRSVFGGEHQGDSVLRLARDGCGGWRGRMSGHGAGVAEAEVNVVVAVHILKMRAAGFSDEHGKFAGPFFHPVHGDAAEERFLSAGVESGGERAFGYEFFFFAGHERVEARAVYSAVRGFFWRGHGWLRGIRETQREGSLATA